MIFALLVVLSSLEVSRVVIELLIRCAIVRVMARQFSKNGGAELRKYEQ